MKPLQYTPFMWVEKIEELNKCVEEMSKDTSECKLLAVDLEYHTFARVSLKFFDFLAHKHSGFASTFNLQ